MGSSLRNNRSYSAHVRRLIAHGHRLHRQAQDALDAGDHKRGLALLEDAELLARDVEQHVKDYEVRNLTERDYLPAQRDRSLGASSSQASKRSTAKQVGSLGMGLGAGFAFGAIIAEI